MILFQFSLSFTVSCPSW